MANGRLPRSVLAPIVGSSPGLTCYLRKDAARAWNAMCKESQRRYGITLRPMGQMSAYRTYDQQVYLYRVSRPGWAARPGTSNHGWGLAVDLKTRQMRWVIDRIGAKYGFSKACSDAQHEWWHLKWNPACTGATWKPTRPKFVPLRLKSEGRRVRWVQKRLRAKGYLSVKVTGWYGKSTRDAVRRFQVKKGLSPATGIVGPRTWKALAK